jgi:hypothetical protein
MSSQETGCDLLQPLFDKWLAKSSLELEVLFFPLSPTTRIPHTKSLTEALYCAVLKDEIYAKGTRRIVQSKTTDSFMGDYRYTHDDKTKRLLGVMEKKSIARVDVPLPNLGVGYRINLKEEKDVQGVAPTFQVDQVKMTRRKERTSFVSSTYSLDFTVVRDARDRILTYEMELESLRHPASTATALLERALALLRRAAYHLQPRAALPVASRKRKGSTVATRDLRVETVRVRA